MNIFRTIIIAIGIYKFMAFPKTASWEESDHFGMFVTAGLNIDKKSPKVMTII